MIPVNQQSPATAADRLLDRAIDRRHVFRLGGLSVATAAVVAACGEVLRAAGDTLWCLVVRLLIAWAFFVPVSMLVVFRWGGEHRAAMLCVVVYLGILALALAYRFHSGKWRTIKLVS